MILAIILVTIFLLLIFFGETDWAPHLLGVMAVMGLYLWPKVNWHKFKLTQSRKFLWPMLLVNFLLMLAYLLNLFTSINLPFSLERVVTLLLTQIFFYLVISQTFSQSWWKNFFWIMKTMIFVLSLFVFFSGFFSQLMQVFPGMNMLYSNYGHNHYAGFLLLIIPLYIYSYLKNRHWFTAVNIILFYILIVLSFARIVLVLSMIELLVSVLIIHRHKIYLNNLEKKFIVMAAIGLMAFLVLQIFFSLTSNFSEQLICRHGFIFRNFCKDIWQDPRLEYWQRFWHIFVKNWFFGSGLDAANLVYPLGWQANQASSAYAHNAYLQFLSEMGLVGGGIYFLAWFLLLRSVWSLGKNNQENSLFANFVLIALGAISVNVLFDYDWQFHAIYLSSWMIGAYCLNKRFNSASLAYTKQKQRTAKFWPVLVGSIRYLSYIFLILILLYVLAFETSLFLRSQKKPAWSITVFPFQKKLDYYFTHHQELSAKNWDTLDRINQLNFQYLFKKYGLDEKFVNKEQVLIKMFGLAGKPLLKDKMLDSFVALFASDNIDEKVKEDLLGQLFENWQLEQSNSEENDLPRGYFERPDAIKLSGIFIDLARNEYLTNDWPEALIYLQKALVVDAYVFFTHDQGLVREIFLKKFLVEDRELNQSQWQAILAGIDSLHPDNSWTVIFIDPEMAMIYQRLADLAILREDWLVAEKYLAKLAAYSHSLMSGDVNAVHYWAKPQLATYYIYRHDWDLARSALEQCLKDFPKHYECTDLSNRLSTEDSTQINDQRYFEISSIILGKQQWQDFF